MLVVTGATGQLGRFVIDELLERIPASDVVAAVRDTQKGADLAAKGVAVRHADYDKPQTLADAFEGAAKILLISSSEVGQRIVQHRAVIDAAEAEGVELLAYTSILHAAESPMMLAEEHVATEQALAASGVPYVLLRNGFYSENYTMSIPVALEHGAALGSSGDGKISAAPRADYAAAAAQVLTSPDQAGRVYELAGDEAFTMTEFAACLAELSGTAVVYKDLPEVEYAKVLAQAGLPDAFAAILANSSACAADGALYDTGQQLSQLIGRPTTPIRTTIRQMLASLR